MVHQSQSQTEAMVRLTDKAVKGGQNPKTLQATYPVLIL